MSDEETPYTIDVTHNTELPNDYIDLEEIFEDAESEEEWVREVLIQMGESEDAIDESIENIKFD